MLFNSYVFIFAFLPIVLIGFHLIGKIGHHRVAISWLVGTSLFFYGWWNPAYLGLILGSIMFNYAVGIYLGGKPSKVVAGFGVAANLGLLAYFKYTLFFLNNINAMTHWGIHVERIVLPLGISFFTFQQITYLIDAYRGLTKEYNFLHYCLFVTFFPQLIAGPIVHHKEMLPQFADDTIYRLKASHLSVGITIFALGLFKKVVFADNLAVYASPVFTAADHGVALTLFEAWGGVLAYTFQLYFDFSGYSDMAIGLARMFGIVLPVNFFSPYKANSIIEFWRRWHITLSRFLRDYLYIPLGGNRKGKVRRYVNLMVTMLLGGFWHGAGWTYIIWGGMHGLYLVINHGWNGVCDAIWPQRSRSTIRGIAFGRIVTFTSVVIAWVMFRAESLNGAMTMYSAMFGFNGISLPPWAEPHLAWGGKLFASLGVTYNGMFFNDVFQSGINGYRPLFLALLVVWFAPNTVEWLAKERPVLDMDRFMGKETGRWTWKPTFGYSLVVAIICIVAIMFVQHASEFLYFQF